MSAIAFDTLRYANPLEQVGLTREQAGGQAETIAELVSNELATKKDIEMLCLETKNLESRVGIEVGSMIAASNAITVTLLKLL